MEAVPRIYEELDLRWDDVAVAELSRTRALFRSATVLNLVMKSGSRDQLTVAADPDRVQRVLAQIGVRSGGS